MTGDVDDEEFATRRRSDLRQPGAAAPASPPAASPAAAPESADLPTMTRSALRQQKARASQEESKRAKSAPEKPKREKAQQEKASRKKAQGDKSARRPASRGKDASLSSTRGSATRSTRRRPELPQLTLPRVQIPSAITETGARVLDITGTRVKPLADSTERVWRPAVEAARWVSPLGWTVLIVGVLAWWAARRYHWSELAMIAAACLVMFLACVVLAIGKSKVRIRTDVDPTRVTVGDPATGRIEVENVSSRGMLPLLVELPVGRSAARFTLPSLKSGSRHEELFVVPTERRGVIQVGPATTVHGDPIGLVRRTVEWTERTELFVHPTTAPLDPLGAGLLRDLEGEVTPDLSMSDLAFHALREYQPGDDRRYIHWRSSAKHGRLLVRQFLDTRRSHLSVVVDTNAESYTAAEDGIELGISVAASLALRSILDEQDTTIVCNDQSASRTTAPLTLDAFSRATAEPCDLFSSAGEAVRLAPDASVAVLVSGAHRPFIQIRRALGQFDVEVIKVAVIVDPDEPVGIRRLEGVTMLTIRELPDLRRVLFAGALS